MAWHGRLYQLAMPHFNRALATYVLDGWVTEHVHILFDMSNLLRCARGQRRRSAAWSLCHSRRTGSCSAVAGVSLGARLHHCCIRLRLPGQHCYPYTPPNVSALKP